MLALSPFVFSGVEVLLPSIIYKREAKMISVSMNQRINFLLHAAKKMTH